MSKIIGKHVPATPKNLLINGNMAIAQRGTSFAAIGNGAYSLDRYINGRVGAAVHTITQDTDVPTLAQSGYLFRNSLRLNLTTPDTAIAATDYVYFGQKIEGYNFAQIAQKPFTLSFWVKATLPGIYCVSTGSGAGDRSFVSEYTINAANTWEYKAVTVQASPSAGTWDYTNGTGLNVFWTLATGSTYQTTAGTWQTGNFIGTSNQVNGVNTGATDFRITGVMLNEGTLAFPFKLFGEDIEGEIAACQRYLEVFGVSATVTRYFGMGTVTSANTNAFIVPFAVKKRDNAVATVSAPSHCQIGNATNNSTASAFSDGGCGVDAAQVTFTATSSALNAATMLWFNNAAGRLYITAEL